jgi:hypothetical protein
MNCLEKCKLPWGLLIALGIVKMPKNMNEANAMSKPYGLQQMDYA